MACYICHKCSDKSLKPTHDVSWHAISRAVLVSRLQAFAQVAKYRAECHAVQPVDLTVDGSVAPLHAEVGKRQRYSAHGD